MALLSSSEKDWRGGGLRPVAGRRGGQAVQSKSAGRSAAPIGGGEGRRFDPAEMPSSLYSAAQETRSFEHLYMLGGGSERHFERRGQFTDVVLSGSKFTKHGAAGWIGQGGRTSTNNL
jgi:hypothetical protein